MNREFILIAVVVFVVVIVGCREQELFLCADNFTTVANLSNCPEPKPTCNVECNDNINCTRDLCNEETEYECEHRMITPCAGNGLCEEGEYLVSDDCPADCADNDSCTADTYSYESHSCVHEPISPCCGNNVCERGETHMTCEPDCEQLLDIQVTRYEKKLRITGAEVDLSSTDYMYVVVEFVMHNIAIAENNEVNYLMQEGFYYDPFKFRAEDEAGNKYDVEYDSDLIKGWRNAEILPLGHVVSASMVFIVPNSAKHIRLIAYDKFNRPLDNSEIY